MIDGECVRFRGKLLNFLKGINEDSKEVQKEFFLLSTSKRCPKGLSYFP